MYYKADPREFWVNFTSDNQLLFDIQMNVEVVI